MLREFFKGLDIASISFPVDMSTRKAKGFAFVEFKSLDNLFEALTMNGQKIINGRVTYVGASNRVELQNLPKCPRSQTPSASTTTTNQVLGAPKRRKKCPKSKTKSASTATTEILEAAKRGQIRDHS